MHANGRLEAAQAVAERIVAAGGSAEASPSTSPTAPPRPRCERLLLGGPVQIVVNNAGIHDDAPLPGMRGAVAARHRRLAERLLQRHPAAGDADDPHPLGPDRQPVVGRGDIGNRGQVNYAAAKGGLNSATKALALELASRGITVNAVAPGLIAAHGRGDLPARDREDGADEARRQPDEVAALVAFLASDEAGYISGQVVSINGAMTAVESRDTSR